MLGPCYDGLHHVPVLDLHDPCPALAALDVTGSALESTVGHPTLRAPIEHDRNPITGFVRMHRTSDGDSAALVLSLIHI